MKFNKIIAGLISFSLISANVFFPLNWIESFSISDSMLNASATVTSGTCGIGVTWRFDGNLLWFEGSGQSRMSDYKSAEATPWYSIRDRLAGKEVMFSGVAYLGAHALENIPVSYINIDKNLTEFGEYSCARSGLTSIQLNCNGENKVSKIGKSAFEGCTSMSAVTFSKSMTAIPESAFAGCTALSRVEIPQNISSIEKNAFADCNHLYVVRIDHPDCKIDEEENGWTFGSDSQLIQMEIIASSDSDAKTIAEKHQFLFTDNFSAQSGTCGIDVDNLVWSYDGNGRLTISGSGEMGNFGEKPPWYHIGGRVTELIIEEGVTSIGDNAFPRFREITSLTFPESIQNIGSTAFFECDALKEVTFPRQMEKICVCAFQNCGNLETISLPDDMDAIEFTAFWNCNHLSGTLTIGAKHVDVNAFAGSNISGLILKDGVQTLEAGAFSWTNLYSVVIPKSVTRLDCSAFYNYGLNDITIMNPNCEIIDNGEWTGSERFGMGSTIYGYAGSTAEAYAKKYNYTFYPLRKIEYKLNYQKYTDHVVISGCDKAADEIIIPAEIDGLPVTKIGNCAFDSCTNLTSVTIPESVTSIEGEAFKNCTNLTSITIPESVTTTCNLIEEVEFTKILQMKYADRLAA